jgi:ribosome-associated protein
MKQKLPKAISPEPEELDQPLAIAIQAAREKKADNVVALDLREVTSFADYFLICSGTSTRQVQAISDEILEKLRAAGTRSLHVEGYELAEWILIDYGSLIVHVFIESARAFYNLERLWRDARRMEIGDASDVMS